MRDNNQFSSAGLNHGSEAEFQHKKRKTRWEKFLERMYALVPWSKLEACIAPFYPKGKGGRPPYPMSAMLRVHCMQLFYNLSDPVMEDDLYEMNPCDALLDYGFLDHCLMKQRF